MNGITKTKGATKGVTKSVDTVKKPDGLRKAVLGTGRHLGYISDTLFDEDLKL